MRRKINAGTTSLSLPVVVYDNTSTTGDGLSGLTHTTSGLVLEYRRAGQSSWTVLGVGTGLSAKTLGTYVSGGIVANGSRAGRYEIDIPDAAVAAGVRMVEICLRGAANMHPVDIEIELDAVNYQDAAGFGLSRLDGTITSRMASYTQPTGFLAATFPTTVASPTNITSASGVAVSSLGSGVITAASIASSALDGKGNWNVGKTGYSLTATTGLGNQTANITGNLSGSVGSVTAAVTTSTFSGTALTAVEGIQDTANDASGFASNASATALKLDTALVLDGAVYQFTVNALELAPSGGGGGSTDWNANERTAIRAILGIPGSGTTPADPSSGILDTIRDAVQTVDSQVDSIVSSVGSIETKVDTVDTNVDTLLVRITSTLFSGITSLADWIRRIARKDAGTAGMIAAEAEIDTGGTSTFTGTTDSLEAIRDAGGGGGGGDPWSTDLEAGNYGEAEAGSIVLAIKAKTDLISTDSIVTSSPVSTSGQIQVPIIIGDAYLAENGRAFEWSVTPVTGFTVAGSSCRFGGKYKESEWLVNGTVTDNGNNTWKLSFDLTEADTIALEAGIYDWSVEIRSTSTKRVTKVRSGKAVQVVEKQTPAI